MGKYLIAQFDDGSKRIVGSFSMERAKLFYKLTKLLEEFVGEPSGIADDIGVDEYMIEAAVFVHFFNQFWDIGWLADMDTSFAFNWARSAAGIVENITLTPTRWIDRNGRLLQAERYGMHDKELEQLLHQRKQEGESKGRRSSNP